MAPKTGTSANDSICYGIIQVFIKRLVWRQTKFKLTIKKALRLSLTPRQNMTSMKEQLQARAWTKENFFLSTDPSLVPIPRLIEVFDSEVFYWTNATTPQAMKEMLENSLSFSMYERVAQDPSTDSSTQLKFIGLARCVTDYVTFAYLTDVWVDTTYQGKGLGSWLIRCVQEALETMPHLRRTVLYTGDWERSVPFYEKLMGMQVLETKKGEGLAVMEVKGRGHPSFGRNGTGYAVQKKTQGQTPL
ncbi:hypothetical protein HJFPF1_07387 [Paramyrothecium foliicola]|nr:hypothetical protein HJFPF1_07387 [Paramyrothecium foliicola]